MANSWCTSYQLILRTTKAAWSSSVRATPPVHHPIRELSILKLWQRKHPAP
jgi:hypothetical protein